MKDSSGESSEECLAYQWWNSQIPNIKNINQLPEAVLPSEAHEIWSKICPLFLLFVIDEQDVRIYWESIQTIVNMFVGDQVQVPNPISKFPEFIKVVYIYQDVLVPKTVEYCVYFIKKFGFHNAAHFFLYQSPVFFLEPTLYLETLLELRYTRYFLWDDFVKKPLLVDAFFEMYQSFFLPIPKDPEPIAYRHRNLLCEVFFSLIQDSFDHYPNIITLINKFLDSCIPIITQYNSDQLFPIYRAIFSTFDLIETKQIQTKNDMLNRSLQLFEASLHSDAIYLTFKFLYTKHYLTSTQILNIISQNPITSLHTFNILMEITDQSTTAPLLILLLRTALHGHLWHRTSFSLFRRCLAKLGPGRSDVRELVTVIVRHLFLWISFASARRKYCARSLMLCESLVLLCESRVSWLQQAILSAAVSLTSASKPVPPYFRSFFPSFGAPVDDALLREWDLFLAQAKLKTFPLDAARAALVMPPGKDAAIGRCLLGGAQAAQPVVPLVPHQRAGRAASSSLGFHAQCEGGRARMRQASALSASASTSFAAARKKQAAAQKKVGGPAVIKRPEGSGRINKSQSEIRIHAKRRDSFLP